MDRLRVLVADNHPVVRAGLRLLISAESGMGVIGEAANELAVVSDAQVLRPDVVVMDISMPNGDGFQATVWINHLCPQARVVALTRHLDKAYLYRMLKAGAYGYVLKQSPSDELLRAIRAVGKGEEYIDQTMSGAVRLPLASDRTKSDLNGCSRISKREEEVLRRLGWGYNNKEIAEQMAINVKTVESHRANAMRKLDLHSRIDIVRFALHHAWLVET